MRCASHRGSGGYSHVLGSLGDFTPVLDANKYGVNIFSKNLFCFVRFYLLLFHLWQTVAPGCQELRASIHDSISLRGRPNKVLRIQDRVLEK